jgi:hypothetical protein
MTLRDNGILYHYPDMILLCNRDKSAGTNAPIRKSNINILLLQPSPLMKQDKEVTRMVNGMGFHEFWRTPLED